jgi:hypothetical protein
VNADMHSSYRRYSVYCSTNSTLYCNSRNRHGLLVSLHITGTSIVCTVVLIVHCTVTPGTDMTHSSHRTSQVQVL